MQEAVGQQRARAFETGEERKHLLGVDKIALDLLGLDKGLHEAGQAFWMLRRAENLGGFHHKAHASRRAGRGGTGTLHRLQYRHRLSDDGEHLLCFGRASGDRPLFLVPVEKFIDR